MKTYAPALYTAALLTACSPAADSNHPSGQNAPANTESDRKNITLLNASYDVARDFYKEYNPLFIKEYQSKHPGTSVSIQQSHGGSSKQALSVANGLQADVVTMNQSSDIDLLEKKRTGTKRLETSPTRPCCPLHQHHGFPCPKKQSETNPRLERPCQKRC